ncbi:MAG: glycosyltransferase family 4 protein [Desulfovibrio sp.]|jgi:glycosyltransferase involved in cell wall biosynthesis|nr:glycosyltransferase family 4 protein [Desulfovibrio sp.]
MTRRNGPAPLLLLLEDLEFGGTQRQALELASRLDEKRFAPRLVTLRAGSGDLLPEAAARGLDVRSLTNAADFSVSRALPALWNYLARERPPLVQLMTVLPNIWGRIFARLLRLPAIIACCRGQAAAEGRHERLLHRLADIHIGNSRSICGTLQHALGIPEDKVVYIPNGVDADFFRPPGASAESSPVPEAGGETALSAAPRDRQTAVGDAAAGKEDGAPGTELCRTPAANPECILCVARLVPAKNHALLLNAFARVLRDRPDAELHLVGDGNCRGAILRQSRTPPLRGKVFLHGSSREVRTWLHKARIFVLASDHEGTPNAVLEAMSCSLPVLATNVGGNAEAVRHERTGLLTPAGDAAALAGGMLRLLNDAGERLRFGRAGRQRVLESYSLRTMVEKHEEVYERVLRGRA